MSRRIHLTDAEAGLACAMVEGSLEVQQDNQNAEGVAFLSSLYDAITAPCAEGEPETIILSDEQVVWLREQLVDTFDDSEDGYETLKEKLA